jgi:ketosteroid isomerase-like protein
MTNSEPTDAQERNVALANDGLEDWIGGDHKATIARFTDDIEVFVPAELGNAGTYRGVEQFQRWFADWDDAWSEFAMTVESIEPVGESHVVAMIRSRGVGIGSGVEVENLLGWVIGVREDRMDFLSLQPDRESAIELARSRETA